MLDKLVDPLRLGFVSTFLKWISLKNLTHFFIAINGHSPSKIVMQPVEKIYDQNS